MGEVDDRGLTARDAEAVRIYPASMPRQDFLARYEVHLDRKLERTLTQLLRLQELRGSGVPADPV